MLAFPQFLKHNVFFFYYLSRIIFENLKISFIFYFQKSTDIFILSSLIIHTQTPILGTRIMKVRVITTC